MLFQVEAQGCGEFREQMPVLFPTVDPVIQVIAIEDAGEPFLQFHDQAALLFGRYEGIVDRKQAAQGVELREDQPLVQ